MKPNVIWKLTYKIKYISQINYLNVKYPLIISFIFIFSSCREKAHDNKEFSRENSKPRRESWIMSS